ncbi:alkylhydroperoxidase AhpD family core domain-containing protein [Actinacidiphila yanglinensis]|uniref:Alkylhydroperoxidase AhpD family core domain-containing protein n=1 Tax=Actinacidiphila yanglinensis TaxID=310779 RepID=A0A1H6E8X8_9ACTN|nr:carboxymuconolactone decarboxylase family protein [Actinacidiphila yanglinensis]SEG93733.1 alkylhydroperoxidase AhpD family core domain-containing protein [Actinacidiphila yanglinensis]
MSTDTSTAQTAGNSATAGTSPHVVPPVRFAVDRLAPHINRAMNALDAASREVGLEAPLLELVRARASQLNGCAYCVDTHTKDARSGGESEQRLYALAVWRETPFFTARERAALALTEAATRLTDGPVPDAVVDEAAEHFNPTELAELLWTITVINAWNRLGAVARPWPLNVSA